MHTAEMKEGMLSCTTFRSTHSMNRFEEKQDAPKKKEKTMKLNFIFNDNNITVLISINQQFTVRFHLLPLVNMNIHLTIYFCNIF